MLETRLQFLIQEDPTSWGAPKPMHHYFWACDLEPMLHKRDYCNEKPVHHSEEQPLLTATRENLYKAMKTQNNQK